MEPRGISYSPLRRGKNCLHLAWMEGERVVEQDGLIGLL